ncbi:unnamed protein product [Ectocarpus sp. 12 AP-2014]
MAPQSKTVCLRAFNEDLDGTNPWERQGPTPPPLPKRIAWPGGKIVSNKDEALANFLRRKVDQGQTLTPEQMAMLKRMAYPNTSASVPPGGFGGGTTAAAARGKRKVRGVGHVHENSGGGGGGSVYARNLLHKLERKVRKGRKHGTPQAGVGVRWRGFERAKSSFECGQPGGREKESYYIACGVFPPFASPPIRVDLPGTRTV